MVIFEIGVDLVVWFFLVEYLVLWVWLCLGNYELVGKCYYGVCCIGNQYLQLVLVECVWVVVCIDGYLCEYYCCQVCKFGGFCSFVVNKKVIIIVVYKLIVIIWYVLVIGWFYQDFGVDYFIICMDFDKE